MVVVVIEWLATESSANRLQRWVEYGLHGEPVTPIWTSGSAGFLSDWVQPLHADAVALPPCKSHGPSASICSSDSYIWFTQGPWLDKIIFRYIGCFSEAPRQLKGMHKALAGGWLAARGRDEMTEHREQSNLNYFMVMIILWWHMHMHIDQKMWYDIWYDVIGCDVILDTVWCDTLWCDSFYNAMITTWL